MTLSRSGVVVVLGTAQTLAWGSTFYLPAILAAPMARDLGIGIDGVFAAFSAALLVGVLIGPLAGGRIDRQGGRGLLCLSSLVFAAGLALLGLAQGPVVMTAAWLVLGVGMTIGLYEAAFSALARLYGAKARGAITGITLFAGFASTVCWPISAALNAEIGWRGACFVWAAAQLLIGLPLNRLLPRAEDDVPAEPAAPAPAGPEAPAATAAPSPAPTRRGRSLWADPGMLLLGFYFAVVWFSSTAMGAHLPRLLQQAGASPTAAIAAAALVGPAQVAGRLLEFSLLQRLHPLLSARLASLAHPLAVAVLLALGAPAAAAFGLLHGAGNGIMTIAKGTLPLALFGPAGYGLRQGLLMVPTRLAQAAAPFVFALLMERFGVGALLVTAGLSLAGLGALLLLRPATAASPA
ncbi:Predicted arabinose efflux permease, MFS family [Tistlia consotensis]|uniref:Predicted arabinose efflux permease, MFS family n=1 Tax=Tistlia consotensis USBA 355 TaxID=560819 RepID=A0A1Y6BI36_9PROT|nr:MFS transporter [Tistlia consotensis]SMF05289.1 Predicted arabinose efflux permease, MFS family [Tistlia consotensis USBA 355]SNR55197.1 Predicted arabinose efflux permease, MFS family [Tistlia consotensis]